MSPSTASPADNRNGLAENEAENEAKNEAEGPPAPLLAASFFLAGLGTVLLGPLLPHLLHEWSLTDERGGLLLLVKFAGACLGGIAVPRRLRLGILAGHMLAALGFGCFALCHSLAQALPALFVSGFGLGEIIASTNILAGRRWPAHTGSALALINLFWSFGAVSTGLLVAALLPHVGWRQPTLAMSALLLLIGAAGLFFRSDGSRSPNRSLPSTSDSAVPASQHLPLGPTLRFGLLLVLYGGLETCLSAWLTTFALRFAGGSLLGGQSGFVVLWTALTAGRALASLAMRRWPESSVQRVSLVLCLVLIGGLAISHTAATLSIACILLGLALAPIFPSTFALLLRRNPPARVAGGILAVSGLGAALFPWLMGAVSTHTGSLRLAMLVPACIVPAMLAATAFEKQPQTASELTTPQP
ncbi:MAG: MFS transporter [Janthinobacterium lividum]